MAATNSHCGCRAQRLPDWKVPETGRTVSGEKKEAPASRSGKRSARLAQWHTNALLISG
jgi:hypothetical protein